MQIPAYPRYREIETKPFRNLSIVFRQNALCQPVDSVQSVYTVVYLTLGPGESAGSRWLADEGHITGEQSVFFWQVALVVNDPDILPDGSVTTGELGLAGRQRAERSGAAPPALWALLPLTETSKYLFYLFVSTRSERHGGRVCFAPCPPDLTVPLN